MDANESFFFTSVSVFLDMCQGLLRRKWSVLGQWIELAKEPAKFFFSPKLFSDVFRKIDTDKAGSRHDF